MNSPHTYPDGSFVEQIIEKKNVPLYETDEKEPDTSALPSLYQKLIPMFTSLFGGILNSSVQEFRKRVDKGDKGFFTTARELFSVDFYGVERTMKDTLGLPQAAVNFVGKVWDFNSFLGLFMYIFLFFVGAPIRLITYTIASKELARQESLKDIKPFLTTPETVVMALVRKHITDLEADDMLDRLGIANIARSAILGVVKRIAPEPILADNYYRGKLSFKDLMIELARHGYDDDQQEHFANVLPQIPPVQDIIRMAVREAFTPELVEAFGYSENFPEEFAKEGKKHGYSREWLEKYWIAHWNLPSPSQVFEMLHRDLIDDDVVDIYLRAADYPPYWRDALKGISYHPFTRVDVRRMYRVGVFDDIPGVTPEQAVTRAYKDLGFDDTKAAMMTKFTKVYEGDEKKKLTESKIVKLYRLGMIDETKTRELLRKLQYRNEYIDYIINIVNMENDEQVLDALIDKLRKLYVIGRINKPEVLSELSKENAVPINTETMFKVWDIERTSVRRLPTRTDVLNWLNEGKLSSNEAETRLIELGYSSADARRYIGR